MVVVCPPFRGNVDKKLFFLVFFLLAEIAYSNIIFFFRTLQGSAARKIACKVHEALSKPGKRRRKKRDLPPHEF